MIVRSLIEAVLSDKYILEKIRSLKKKKGIENDLRFLFERAYFEQTNGRVPMTEVKKRSDMRLPEDPPVWIEFKCWDNVFDKTTQAKIKKDFKSLLGKDKNSTRYFIYFGLYGKHQPPFTSKFNLIQRLKEISQEIAKITSIARQAGASNIEQEISILRFNDRILYAAWYRV